MKSECALSSSVLKTKISRGACVKKEILFRWNSLQNGKMQHLVKTKSVLHQDRGETTSYGETSCPGSQLVQLYAGDIFKFEQFWLVQIM